MTREEAIISIHAPREGSDKGLSTSAVWPSNFYPRSPRGERPAETNVITTAQIFLSTLPARGATRPVCICLSSIQISIHAPREGSDVKAGAAEAEE